MEIQTFLLCKQISVGGGTGFYDASYLGIHSFYPIDGLFPMQFGVPYYMLLRRQQRDGDEAVTLRFDLVDQDGRSVGEPVNLLASSTFPHGQRFMPLTGHIHFQFPRAGEYGLDITADEDNLPSVYRYNIDVTGSSQPA